MKLSIIIALLLFACYIGYRIAKRMARNKDPNKKPGCMMSGYVIIVYLCLCSLSFPFLNMTISGLYNNLVDTRYEATVVSVRDYISEDSDGNKRTMYAPTVSFTSNSGQKITRELNIGSGDPYIVGEMHPVSYDENDDQLNSRSVASVLLLIGGLIMSLLLLGYVLIGFAYAFRIPIGITGARYTGILFIYILMPIGMIGLNVGLIYYVYQRLVNGYKSDQPIWVLFIVGFFILVLTLAKIGIVRMLLEKETKKK